MVAEIVEPNNGNKGGGGITVPDVIKAGEQNTQKIDINS